MEFLSDWIYRMIHKAYIINLKRRQDKKRHMLEQIVKAKKEGCEFDFEFYNAIDGTETKQSFRTLDWFDPTTKKGLTKGEIGCALSHFNIWKIIVDKIQRHEMNDNDLTMILEDDVVFPSEFQDRVHQALADLGDQTVDLIYLHRKPFDFHRETIVSPLLRIPLRSYWTCGYLISGAGARKLVNSGYDQALIPVDEFLPAMYGIPINQLVDEHFQSNEKIQALAIYPSIISLKDDAFNDSETFHSEPFIKPSSAFKYSSLNGSGNFMIYYKGESQSEYYQNFLRWCQVYGLPLTLDDNIEYQEANMKMLIDATLAGLCTILPLTSPGELCEILLTLPPNFSICLPKITISVTRDGSESRILAPIEYKNLISIIDDTIKISFEHKKSRIILPNNVNPAFVVSDGYSWVFRSIENYTGPGWNEYYGMQSMINEKTEYPTIYVGAIVSKNEKITDIFKDIEYPDSNIELHIRKSDDTHHARYLALSEEIETFKRSGKEYLLIVSHDCMIHRKDFLKRLIVAKKRVIAPMISGKGILRNFWGALDMNGWYARSEDYIQIAEMSRKGVWQVPYISGVMMFHRDVIDQLPFFYQTDDYGNVDMVICNTLRQAGFGLYLDNNESYGYFEAHDVDNLTLKDIYQLPNLRKAWEKKYLHPEMLAALGVLQECPIHELADGIFNFPLFSQTFCSELIELMEQSNSWSAGRNNHIDPRLGNNYYENHPTVDTQLFQVGLKEAWETIVKLYIAPVASHIYSGYNTRDINLAFVVRYRYDEQSKLAPHHDSSTYTVNIALNQGGIDYQGGGCKFLRQNLVVKNQSPGMCCIHPGRLTAYHEGLPVISGTRYILVSFIN
jgi:GR25 family glycosyltransferase involved in LPS biosynthesis